MVLRNRRWRLTGLVAACIAAAGTVGPAAATGLEPMAGSTMPPLPHAGAPPGGRLVWGGPVPPQPLPGQETVYVPSQTMPAMAPPAAIEPIAPQTGAVMQPLPPVDAEPSYASLGDDPPALPEPVPGRGALEPETPTGYVSLPAEEAMCRRALAELGAKFTEAGSVGSSASCGIPNALKVHVATRGIAMQPAATLNCRTALAVARWLDDDVRSAARWKLWKNPTAVINASSYRCSRIAGSRTVSEHAGGNALDVGGFRFSDGSTVRVEPKGFFSFRERGFQRSVRQASCRYFGTVLGPGYNRAHDDHFHLDGKVRRRPVCK